MIRLLDLSLRCKSDQWQLQSHRMEDKYWKYINFIGHMESIQQDSKRLLEQVGAWEEIGALGWGSNGTERIFGSTTHDYEQISSVMTSYTSVVDNVLRDIYKKDLENERFGF